MGESIRRPTAKYPNSPLSTHYSVFDSPSMIVSHIQTKNCIVYVLHIENTSQFYVQTEESLVKTVDFSKQIQTMVAKYEKLPHQNGISDGKRALMPHFKIGDLLLSRFEEDEQWYRCFVTDFSASSNTASANDDGFEYEVYFVDYGNKQKSVRSSNFHTFDAIKASQVVGEKELSSIVNLPFQAICCELKDKKISDSNTDILKSLVKNNDEFKINIETSTTQRIWPTDNQDNNQLKPLEITKYIVSLYSSSGKPMCPQFEAADTHLKALSDIILKNESVHTCKISDIGPEGSFYVQFVSSLDRLELMDRELNTLAKQSDLRKWKLDRLAEGQFVLAKMYIDETEFNWYRAVITKIHSSKRVQVFYFDYGNYSQIDLIMEDDLLKLPEEFSVKKCPMLAFGVHLNGTKFDIDAHREHLADLLNEKEEVAVKIVDHHQLKRHSLDVCEYDVEIWDSPRMKHCLNRMIDPNYAICLNPSNSVKKPLIPKCLVIKEISLDDFPSLHLKIPNPFFLSYEYSLRIRN